MKSFRFNWKNLLIKLCDPHYLWLVIKFPEESLCFIMIPYNHTVVATLIAWVTTDGLKVDGLNDRVFRQPKLSKYILDESALNSLKAVGIWCLSSKKWTRNWETLEATSNVGQVDLVADHKTTNLIHFIQFLFIFQEQKPVEICK